MLKTFAITIGIILAVVIGGFVYITHENTKPAGLIFASEVQKENISNLKTEAENGDKVAQFKLAVAYDIGQNVARNASEAVQWAEKSANQGFARAQVLLGLLYTKGEGAPVDDSIAYKWIFLAANLGDHDAQVTLKMYDRILSQESINAGKRLADEWKQHHG